MEKTLQKVLAAAAACLFASTSVSALAAQPTIPIIVKDTTAFYWKAMLAGARKAGKDLNVNVPELGAQNEKDVKAEVSTLRDALVQKPIAIVIAPSDPNELAKPIEDAAKWAKIVDVDSPADAKVFSAQIMTDNVAAGRLAADGLADAIKEKYGKAEGEIALIASAAGGATDQRAKGFKDELAAKYPDFKIAMEKIGDGQAANDAKNAADALADANLRGVFASDIEATEAVGQALAETKKADAIKAIGFDSDPKIVKLLQEGSLAGLVVEDPFKMGYDGVRIALAAAKGEQTPAMVAMNAELVTKANMDSPRAQELINPKIK